MVETYSLYMSSWLNATLIRLSENIEQPEEHARVLELLFSLMVAFKIFMKCKKNSIIAIAQYNV